MSRERREKGERGRDTEAGAAERRLADALRAQASLGARPSAAPGVRSGQARRPQARHSEARGPQAGRPKPRARSNPVRSRRARRPGHNRAGRPGRARRPIGQSGRTGAGASRDRSTPRRVRDPATAHRTAPAGAPGRGTTSSRRPRSRPPTPGRPRRPPRSSRPPIRRAAPADPPGPSGPARAGRHSGARPRAVVLDVRLRVALLVGLLAGSLLGSALALLSVLDPGLLPALG